MTDDHDKATSNLDLRELMSLMTSAQAPVVYCDGVLAAGLCDGVMNLDLTLTAFRTSILPNGGGTHSDVVTVGHVRLSAAATRQLLSVLGSHQVHAFAGGAETVDEPLGSSQGRH